MLTTLRLPFRSFAVSFLLAGSLLLAGCDLVGNEEENDPLPKTTDVIVGNSGNFTDQNGFLTVYDTETQQTDDLSNLGAFIQSMRLSGDSLYVVTNTFSGGRVEVFSDGGMRQHQAVTPGTPRAIAVAGAQKAYVAHTNFASGAGFVAVYDRTTGQFRDDSIAVGSSPEDVLVLGNRAYVANYGASGDGTTLSVIDVASEALTGSIELGCDGPNELFVDGEGELVVVCQGKTVYNEDFSDVLERTDGQVVFVDPTTETVVDRIELDRQVGSANFTQAAAYAVPSEELYVIDGTDTVLRFDTDANAVTSTITVPADPSLVGLTAVAYDAAAERLYLGRYAVKAGGDPDPTSAGRIVALDRDGNVATTFTVGPSPGHIVLRQTAE